MSFLLTPAVIKTGEQLNFWQRITPPEDISENGYLIDYLFNYTTVLNLVFFILVCGGLFGFSFLYNRKRHPKPYYTYGNKKVHVMVATVIGVAVFLGVDLNISRISNNDFLSVFAKWPSEDEDIVRVEVLAQQWMWNYRYAGRDGVFNTEDDVVTVNDLRLPTGKKVVFQIISKDVIHSHFLPNARRKVDAIPGRLTRMWVKLNKTGVFDVACAEMCGTFHYRMQAKMHVYTPEEYQEWLEEAQRLALETNDTEIADNFWGWKWSK
jgi:cytochrome c oxidase subunit 2